MILCIWSQYRLKEIYFPRNKPAGEINFFPRIWNKPAGKINLFSQNLRIHFRWGGFKYWSVGALGQWKWKRRSRAFQNIKKFEDRPIITRVRDQNSSAVTPKKYFSPESGTNRLANIFFSPESGTNRPAKFFFRQNLEQTLWRKKIRQNLRMHFRWGVEIYKELSDKSYA